MHKKFIIYKNQLRKGLVDIHSQLIGTGSFNREDVTGGGYFHYDKDTDSIYFYGTSIDFGSVTKEQLINALEYTLFSKREEAYSYYYSTSNDLDFNKFEEINLNIEE